ncbi:MAG: methylated-DNA--[protein]-cysteine S-methyltransferase [Acidimicrobiales bacterium]
MLAAGDQAPSFALPDQDGTIVDLASLRGRKVLVYFYPKADTPGCTTQACGLRDIAGEVGDTAIIGISPDPPSRLKKFADKYELGFTLLSTPSTPPPRPSTSGRRRRTTGAPTSASSARRSWWARTVRWRPSGTRSSPRTHRRTCSPHWVGDRGAHRRWRGPRRARHAVRGAGGGRRRGSAAVAALLLGCAPGRPHGADPALAALGAQLGAYLAGEPVDFELPIEWERVEGLRRDVLQAICSVGHGCTTTYGAVAGRVGRPGEARAVGQALKRNPWALVVPCHRVVAGTGALTGYAGGPTTGGHLDVKAALLAHEREWAEPTLLGGG